MILTAVADLAAPPEREQVNTNTYVRLSEKHLSSPDAISQIEDLYLLFLRGDVAKAISAQRWADRRALLKALTKFFSSKISGLMHYVATRDVIVAPLEGRVEIKKSATT